MHTARRMSELQLPYRKKGKTAQTMDEVQTPHEDSYEADKIALNMSKIKDDINALDRELSVLETKYMIHTRRIEQFDHDEAVIKVDAKNVKVYPDMVAELKAEYRNLPFWKGKRKKEIEREIERLESEGRVAKNNFWNKHHFDFSEAFSEIRRIQKEKRWEELNLEENKARAADVLRRLDALELEYHAQRLIANGRPDRRRIDEMLEQLRDTPPIIRDRLKNMEINKSLDVITAEAFDQVIEKLQ